jgi:hypothetical protein
MRRIAPMLVVLGLFAVACGSSGSSKTAVTVASGSPSAGSGSTATTNAPSFSGSSSSNFCDLARSVENASGQNQTDLKAAYDQFDKVANQFVSKAPSAIKADAQTLVNGVRQLETALKKANYDYAKVDPNAAQSINTPAFSSAATRVTAYLAQVCHVGTTPTSGP